MQDARNFKMRLQTFLYFCVRKIKNVMTTEQLDSIITHYKQKAVHAYNDNDMFTCNRMIAIVHELEGNYDDYLDHEYDDDHLELYFDIILPKATATTSLFFTSDPYDNGDEYEVLGWIEEGDEDQEDDFDEDFDEDFDVF